MASEDKIEAYRRRKDERRKKLQEEDIVEWFKKRRADRREKDTVAKWKRRKAERRATRNDARWITIGAMPGNERQGIPAMKGRHVLIDDDGTIISGAGGSLTGVELKGAKSSSGEVKVDPGKTSEPLKTSPAGAEGKSGSEVAAEAKKKEGEAASAGAEVGGKAGAGEGDKPVEKKITIDEVKEAIKKEDLDTYHKFLEELPEGAKLVHGSDEFKKAENGEFYMKGFEEPGSEFHVKDFSVPWGEFKWSVIDPSGKEDVLHEGKGGAAEEGGEGDKPDWLGEFGAVWENDVALEGWLNIVPKDTQLVLKDKDGKDIVIFEKAGVSDSWDMYVPGKYTDYLTTVGAVKWISEYMKSAGKWQTYDPITGIVFESEVKGAGEETGAETGAGEEEVKGPAGKYPKAKEEPVETKTTGKKSAKYKGEADTTSYAKSEAMSSGLSRVTYGDEAYSPAARKGAISEKKTEIGCRKVHDKLFAGMKEWWNTLTDDQKSKVKEYSGSYHDTNEPLRGATYYDKTGYKNDAYIRNKIKAVESALDRSVMKEPIVITRGVSLGTFRSMLAHKTSAYKDYSSAVDYGDDLVGKTLTDPSFLSCTAAEKAGFDSKPVQLRIFCPAGTKAAYINPISEYGMMASDPDMISPSESPMTREFEVLLQRGSKFEIKGVTKKSGKLYLDLDLVEQNPRPLKVSGSIGKYDDGKDAYDF